MKAVMYGGGNIGRGFIGAVLSRSGYEVVFIDVVDSVVESLNARREYPVRLVSDKGHEDIMIKNVRAVNGRDRDAVAAEIADADVMATAVGANILKFIAPNIAAGISRRFDAGDRPLNIIICENLMDADKILGGLIKENLSDEERRLFDERIGLVEASIGRMVPVQTDEMKDGDPLRVCVEKYGYLPVDKAAFKGGEPSIEGMVPFEPFDFFIKRKLYIHNMGHAICAYLGMYEKIDYICDAVAVPEIYAIAENAMLQSAEAMAKKYGQSMDGLMRHIYDLLNRFSNRALLDTCERVGRDQKRKLAKDDRLVGAAELAVSMGITPSYICVGIAGALYKYCSENGIELTGESGARVFAELSGIPADSTTGSLAMELFDAFIAGRPVREIMRLAEQQRAATAKDVI